MTLGPLMLDLNGLEMTQEERDVMRHPLVGGVILFSRNYASKEQLGALIGDIQANRRNSLLIAVDHEGGAVQRFRHQFTRIPACTESGTLFEQDPQAAHDLAYSMGSVMASELRAVGVDFSFAPVLDLGECSHVINDRAFHKKPEVISKLAAAYRRGMHDVGMSAVGKHFPGHGSIEADSHHQIPIDERSFEEIEMADLIPFAHMINNGLEGIMPAHVIYPQMDEKPAGFSPFWLQEILRKKMKFQGAIFSDDISMAGAEVAGDYLQRTRAALEAGCDMVLICNNPEGAAQVIDRLGEQRQSLSQVRLIHMHGHRAPKAISQKQMASQIALLDQYSPERELDLGDDQLV